MTIRVLVVDDSETNRLVATAMLADHGLGVDTARSADEAVAMARASTYALILMDLSLPDRSGLWATAEIRGLDGDKACVPIVALTAHATTLDRAACLGAGMNDFIAKPLDIDVLGVILQRWCGIAPPAGDTRPAATTAHENEPLDRAVFAGLRATVTRESLELLVARFLAEIEDRVTCIRAAARAEDGAAVREQAHAVKSTAALFGLRPLARAAADLEALAAHGDATKAAVEDLALGARAARAALRAAMGAP